MTKKLLYSLVAVYIITTGCKKDLDLFPTDSVTEEVAFTSVGALQKGLNAGYSRYSTSKVSTMYATSLTSDEVKFGANNGGSGQFSYRLQYGADGTSGGDVTGMFYSYYTVIDLVNRVLAKADDVPTPTAADVAERDKIKGQLLALRAMAHFELLQAYSNDWNPSDPLGVPVYTESCLDCEKARSSMGDVMALVESDLNAAKGLMPDVTGTYNDLALNKISVTAYQARIALYKGEWQAAADHATTVISSGIEPLVSGSDFAGIWTDDNTHETLFRSRFETSAFLGSQWTSTNGGVLFSPSDKLTATYSSSDIRSTAFIGTNANGRYVKKFGGSSRGGSVVDLKGIRTAEMYLIRAEARAELNNLSGAADDINALRAMRITGYTPIAYSDKTQAINDILLERYKELAFEGFRFFDLKRRDLDLQRNASDVDSPLWQTLPATSHKWVYPIPFDEMLANRNMQQNPEY